MVSYHLISSSRVWESSRLFSRALAKTSCISVTGMLVKGFVMSSEATVNWGSTGVSLRVLIKSVVLSRLDLLGSGASCLFFWDNSLANL